MIDFAREDDKTVECTRNTKIQHHFLKISIEG